MQAQAEGLTASTQATQPGVLSQQSNKETLPQKKKTKKKPDFHSCPLTITGTSWHMPVLTHTDNHSKQILKRQCSQAQWF